MAIHRVTNLCRIPPEAGNYVVGIYYGEQHKCHNSCREFNYMQVSLEERKKLCNSGLTVHRPLAASRRLQGTVI